MMLLARTDPEQPKHKGISYFLLNMKTPGVSIRPLTNMADTPSFNEVFFDNVRVPKKDLLGEVNRGWYYATTTLDFERSGIINGVSLQKLVQDTIDFAAKGRRACARRVADDSQRARRAVDRDGDLDRAVVSRRDDAGEGAGAEPGGVDHEAVRFGAGAAHRARRR